MIGNRKIAINIDQVQAAHNVNAQLDYAGERWAPRHPIPKYVYKTTQFSFRNTTILDWMIDPVGEDKDIIIWLSHRGEIRFEYDIALETKLINIFAAIE